ncbi:hypothetical protein SLS55_004995 [Diplodia seriata]|uniref:Uncharacterized protein n=1 Tax=Diplodia seriata TaxID=420778 RepID=A0ABR3CKY8_9PEZI
MDVMPNEGMVAGTAYMFGVEAGDPGTAQDSVIDDETQKAYMLTRRLNATSWRLLGHAVNLADEISLVEGLSRSREPQPRAPTHVRRRARIRDLLIPLTWEISFRIGRSSFLKLPSPSASTADEYTDESEFSALLSSRAELYRLARLIENSLYSSVSATKDIITADRYPEMVASLVDIMTDWWNKFQRVPGVWSDRVPFGVKMSDGRNMMQVPLRSGRRSRFNTTTSGRICMPYSSKPSSSGCGDSPPANPASGISSALIGRRG